MFWTEFLTQLWKKVTKAWRNQLSTVRCDALLFGRATVTYLFQKLLSSLVHSMRKEKSSPRQFFGELHHNRFGAVFYSFNWVSVSIIGFLNRADSFFAAPLANRDTRDKKKREKQKSDSERCHWRLEGFWSNPQHLKATSVFKDKRYTRRKNHNQSQHIPTLRSLHAIEPCSYPLFLSLAHFAGTVKYEYKELCLIYLCE